MICTSLKKWYCYYSSRKFSIISKGWVHWWLTLFGIGGCTCSPSSSKASSLLPNSFSPVSPGCFQKVAHWGHGITLLMLTSHVPKALRCAKSTLMPASIVKKLGASSQEIMRPVWKIPFVCEMQQERNCSEVPLAVACHFPCNETDYIYIWVELQPLTDTCITELLLSSNLTMP